MPATNDLIRNSALLPLQVLSGTWNAELSEASFLGDPFKKVVMQVAFEWIENGAFLVMRMPLDPPDSIWIVGRDAASDDYQVLYFDNRNVSRNYQMSFSNRTWKIWRNAPTFSQRFEGKISEDANFIKAKWEKSLDGKTWEHDFSIAYARL